MADETENQDLDIEASLEATLAGEIDLGDDEIPDEVQLDAEAAESTSPTRKVELDTAGLDLDILEDTAEEEFEVEPTPIEEPKEVEEAPARPKWFWPAVLGGGGLVVLALVAVVVFVFLIPEPAKPPPPPPKKKTPFVQPEPGVPILALKSFTIPLDQPRRNLLRVAVQLEFSSDLGKDFLAKQTIQVRDTIYQALLGKRQGQLKGAAARTELRKAILAALNDKFEGRPVKQVYFTEFFVL